MKSLSTHEQIRLKITAFLFNTRVDALRGEIYRALCLHVLTETGEETSRDRITELVAYALGKNVKVTDSLKTIIYDELNNLVRDGAVICEKELYSLGQPGSHPLPDTTAEQQLVSFLHEAIRPVVVKLNPTITAPQISTLVDFFVELSTVLARFQLNSLSLGRGVQDFRPERDDVAAAVGVLRERYELDRFIDANEFIWKTLIRPSQELADYLYRFIQVNVIVQLLTWDPDLESLRTVILGQKTLYLDSSVLFVLMQKHHPLHHFVTSLLRASYNDLHVHLKVYSHTLQEYQNAIDAADRDNSQSYRQLRDLARICKRDGSNPMDYLDNSILADYVSENIDQIDLGTWQRYVGSVSRRSLEAKLRTFPAEIDDKWVYFPIEDRQKVKEALTEASLIQVRKRKRGYAKGDPEHDAKLYHFITSTRTRSSTAIVAVGYDRYLLTLDGSLVHFAKLQQISVTETYFIYPNQWYELAFPFLRISAGDMPGVAMGLASLVFSGAFPALTSLIPLELCKYIFDQGGSELPMGSIRAVAETMLEERLVETLKPDSEDNRKKEEAKMRIQRLVAQEEAKRNRIIQELDEKAGVLRAEFHALSSEVDQLAASKDALLDQVAEHQETVMRIGESADRIQALTAQHDETLKAEYARHEDEKNRLQKEFEAQQLQKDSELSRLGGEVQGLKRSLENLTSAHENDRAERTKLKAEFDQFKEQISSEKAQQIRTIKKTVVTLSMVFGLGVGLSWLIQLAAPLQATIASVIVMALGMVLYHATSKSVISILIFGSGFLISFGYLIAQNKVELWLALVPMAWSIITGATDIFIERQAKK